MGKEESSINVITYSLWAKLNPFHSLYCHMFETGMTACVLLRKSVYTSLVPVFCQFTGWSREECINSVAFLIACHDIGKAHPSFQCKAKGSGDLSAEVTYNKLINEAMISNFEIDGFRHEAYSADIMMGWLKKRGLDRRTSRTISQVYGMHHLSKNGNGDISISSKDHIEKWVLVQETILNKLCDRFPFSMPEGTSYFTNKIDAFCTLLLSFLYRCDWIASSLLKNDASNDNRYEIEVVDTLNSYIKEIGIHKIPKIEPCQISNIKELFPALAPFKLYPMQKLAEDIADKYPSFDCVILEDQPGHGKTEAGLYLATKSRGEKQGIFFGLPTNATEQAMNPRIQEMLDTLYGPGMVNVRHASGKSWITEELKEDTEDFSERYYYASGKAMKLIYPFATGTVDQIETTVLRKRFGTIGLIDLACKVVVIDEMHAYDAYMRGVLLTALAWLREYKVPVVIMSATLPNDIKKQIAQIYTKKIEQVQNSYPMITIFQNGEMHQIEVKDTKREKSYQIEVVPILEDDKKIAEVAFSKVERGGCLAVIVNTVDKAKCVYRELLRIKGDLSLFLLHARFPDQIKEEKTGEIIKYFGKNRSHRPNKAIVVSTQILEQSIDVDFDYMMTELAPMDLILQRIGREWRHEDEGTIRADNRNMNYPEVVIMVDSDQEKIKKNLIYAPVFLFKTYLVLEKNAVIDIPGDIRKIVEKVYQNGSTELESWLQKLQKENMEHMSVRNAKAVINSINKPEDGNHFQLHELKTTLLKHLPTRISDIETVKVSVIPEEIYREVEQQEGKVSKKLAAKILYHYTTQVPAYKLDNISQQYIEGKSWLEEVRCYLEGGDEIFIDQTFGLEIKTK